MNAALQPTPARRALPVVATLVLLLGLLLALASTYVGSGSSPYDTCQTPSGRTVSCDLLEQVQRR